MGVTCLEAPPVDGGEEGVRLELGAVVVPEAEAGAGVLGQQTLAGGPRRRAEPVRVADGVVQDAPCHLLVLHLWGRGGPGWS